MGRHSIGMRTAVGSVLLPISSLYAAAAAGGAIREIGIFNTAATAVALALARLTTAGTKPAALTDAEWDQVPNAAQCTAHNTHTVGPTITEIFKRVTLGAAIGAGVIWTFGGSGLVIPVGVANGIGIYVPTGTGQICDVTIDWEE